MAPVMWAIRWQEEEAMRRGACRGQWHGGGGEEVGIQDQQATSIRGSAEAAMETSYATGLDVPIASNPGVSEHEAAHPPLANEKERRKSQSGRTLELARSFASKPLASTGAPPRRPVSPPPYFPYHGRLHRRTFAFDRVAPAAGRAVLASASMPSASVHVAAAPLDLSHALLAAPRGTQDFGVAAATYYRRLPSSASTDGHLILGLHRWRAARPRPPQHGAPLILGLPPLASVRQIRGERGSGEEEGGRRGIRLTSGSHHG
uniref:Uncharacterized protein n=1 Tax=Oryza sativa subsp. japonica TaxID=39947 RepID=Q6ZGT8_ORYSJ|nr:hypothetical protein [Oryza sativa Japonica Group]